ncbi:equilibrative nucleoside transporter 1 isoform X1 [Anabrus simplex]|uniref:equilibrative nucleoside transporter 1 isoform X1 n=1 Tax=Anabrus simplex TaxID=316456 RepID=UPI0034DD9803
MNQSASFSNSKPSGPENQFLLNETVPKNGSTPRGTRKNVDFHEKQPLFERPSEPVRLTPAWEETNLPNDELNFKSVTMEQVDMEMNPPTDRLKLVYFTLLIHGVGTLMPWNMFINAKAYFVHYKLAKVYTGVDSEYARNFLPYVGFAAQIPNLLFNWLNIFVQMGGNLTTRIVWSIIVEVCVFIFTVTLAMSDSSSWPGVFFWLTMVTVVILNMANGIYQNTVFGMAAKLPFKYTGAVILGANISGTFSSLISILSLAMAPNPRTAAIYYFITALFVLLACFDTYFALPLNRFYRYHELLNEKEKQSQRRANVGLAPHTPYWTIFLQCLPQLFNVFFVFFITLSLFPSVHSDIKRSDKNFIISDHYFTEVTCFLTFNVCAMLGSLLSAWVTWPGPKHLVIFVVLRVLFIPFFLACNYVPLNRNRLIPVFIENDYVYWAGAVLMGLTSGHFSSLAMMYCPRSVEPQHAATAGMFGAAALVTGIFSGIVVTMVFPELVARFEWKL